MARSRPACRTPGRLHRTRRARFDAGPRDARGLPGRISTDGGGSVRNTMNFGVRNELRAHTRRQMEKKAERMDAAIALVCLALVAAFAVAQYLDQAGAFK